MTNYPTSIDDNTSLPPSYGADSIYSFKFQCNIASGNSEKLLNSATQTSLVLAVSTFYLLKIDCMVVNTATPATSTAGRFTKDINVYCNENGVVTYTQVNSTSSDPGGCYSLTLSTGVNVLYLTVGNTSANAASAVAILSYVSI